MTWRRRQQRGGGVYCRYTHQGHKEKTKRRELQEGFTRLAEEARRKQQRKRSVDNRRAPDSGSHSPRMAATAWQRGLSVWQNKLIVSWSCARRSTKRKINTTTTKQMLQNTRRKNWKTNPARVIKNTSGLEIPRHRLQEAENCVRPHCLNWFATALRLATVSITAACRASRPQGSPCICLLCGAAHVAR